MVVTYFGYLVLISLSQNWIRMLLGRASVFPQHGEAWWPEWT